MPLEQVVRHGGKELLQRGAAMLSGEAAEGTWKEVASNVAKATAPPPPVPSTPTWSPNALNRHTSYKQNIKSKGARQWVEDLDPFDVNNLEELELLDSPAAARYYNLVQQAEYASKDKMGIAGDLWHQVNEETIGLGRHLEDLRTKAREVHMNPEDDFVSGLSAEEADAAIKKEIANRINAENTAGDSSDLTIGTTESDVKSYGGKRPQIAQQRGQIPREVENLITILGDQIADMPGQIPFKQQHHELIKAYFAPFSRRMRELGSELDVVNLAYMADSMGFGLGDYLAAMKMMDQIPHNIGHTALLEEGVQPGTIFRDWNLESEKARIMQIDNVADLTKEFKRAIEEVGKPMREQMNLWQESWEMIPTADRVELIRLWNIRHQYPKGSDAYKQAEVPYRELKNRLEAQIKVEKANIDESDRILAEAKQIKRERRMGG